MLKFPREKHNEYWIGTPRGGGGEAALAPLATGGGKAALAPLATDNSMGPKRPAESNQPPPMTLGGASGSGEDFQEVKRRRAEENAEQLAVGMALSEATAIAEAAAAAKAAAAAGSGREGLHTPRSVADGVKMFDDKSPQAGRSPAQRREGEAMMKPEVKKAKVEGQTTVGGLYVVDEEPTTFNGDVVKDMTKAWAEATESWQELKPEFNQFNKVIEGINKELGLADEWKVYENRKMSLTRSNKNLET